MVRVFGHPVNLTTTRSNSENNGNYEDNDDITIVRSNKIVKALDLPTILNPNPRSVEDKNY